MSATLRRLLLWTLICSTSAAPSFALAMGEFDRGAMIVGVALFIAIYTLATSTSAFARFHRRPFVRRTLYIGYGLRLVLSIMMPLGYGGVPGALVMFADMWPGLLSLNIVKSLGFNTVSFAGTLLTTMVQGALLNLILFIIMAIVYGLQRAFMTPPAESGPRGFEVMMRPPDP